MADNLKQKEPCDQSGKKDQDKSRAEALWASFMSDVASSSAKRRPPEKETSIEQSLGSHLSTESTRCRPTTEVKPIELKNQPNNKADISLNKSSDGDSKIHTQALSNNVNDNSDDDEDEDDDDYVPSEHEASEEDSSGEDEGNDDSTTSPGKSSKGSNNIIPEDTERGKAKADALWASFMSDVDSSKSMNKPETKTDKQEPTISTLNPPNAELSSSSASNEASPITAGKRSGGLNAVLGFINKKQKISTLDKSKLDWEKYKAEAGLTDELKAHRNSKNSYLEKKEFLERADHRQFEKEKEARTTSRSKR